VQLLLLKLPCDILIDCVLTGCYCVDKIPVMYY